jgi:hypothetical protein
MSSKVVEANARIHSLAMAVAVSSLIFSVSIHVFAMDVISCSAPFDDGPRFGVSWPVMD